jgi:hypothetical protein
VDLARGNKFGRADVRLELLSRVFFMRRAGEAEANGMRRCTASRTLVRRRSNAAEFSPLVLGLFSPYLLFDPEKRGL